MIKIVNMNAGYHDEEILHDITLDIHPGKVTVILGPNGSGKSTLLKSLIRFNSMTSGSVEIDGKSITSFDSSSLAQKIAYLPQGKNVPDITVSRMVLHGRFAYLKYPRRYRKEDYEMVNWAMEKVGIENLADRNVNQLSGGTKQKVYIAMTMAQDTPIILMDEPTTYLDISHSRKLMGIAKELALEGKAIVMVLHDLSQALKMADEIVVMENGCIKAVGTPEEIYMSHILDQIFQVHISRVQTDSGWQYYYE